MPPRGALLVSTLLLLTTGTLAWGIRSQGEFRITANRLDQLPRDLAGYQGTDLRFSDSVYAALDDDSNLLRRYTGSSGITIWLYIGYYGTAKGGRPAHVPESCYTGQGFSIEDWSLVPVPGRQTGERIDRMVVRRGGQRRLILYWFQSAGNHVQGTGVQQNLLRLRNRLLGERDDGSLIRVSTTLPPGDHGETDQRLSAFVAELLASLPAYWPLEARS